jgi:two-component system, cell cycle sensor histidine kinase and response regulator CckA
MRMHERFESGGMGPVADPEELSALVEADPTWRETLDEVATLACRLLDVPLAQVNVVLPDRQRSLSSVAASPTWESWNGPREASLEGSYCKYVMASGEPLVIENSEADPLVMENLATTESGVRSYAAVPLKNDEGVTLGTLCVVGFEPREWEASRIDALSSLAQLLMREIRGRIDAERSLRAGEARFRALIENGEDLITILDLDGRFLYASPAYERILGFEAEDLAGTPFEELIHPSDKERWVKNFFARLATPSDRASGEWRLQHRSGDWRVVDASGVNLLHEPAVRGLVLNMIDVTAEKRVALELHQAQKMEAVGRLAGGVAHDFNNLLTAIKGNSSFLLARGDLSPETEKDFREMLDAVKRGASLTKQLLSFSREQVLDVKGLDLGKVAQEIVPLVTRLTGPKVRLQTEFDLDLPILAAEGQVGQVIMNLAVNARDAMAKGGTLRIETRDVTVRSEQAGSHGGEIRPGRYAQLVVADDGVGMTRAVQTRIFDPFYSTKQKGKGTGLGLSIVWGIIKQLNGHVHVYSESGRGTTFRIYFPMVDRDLLKPKVNGRAPKKHRPKMRKGSILVVEDQPEIRRIIEKVLASEGHTVWICGSGEQALELASKLDQAPDLLLSDVLLPGLSGPAAAWQLLGRWPDLAVIFTSGYTHGELVNQDMDLRVAGFLPKPFGMEELSEAVSQALRC